ncbi:hypothetical protein BHU16_02005 [Tannerella sp. oral taxon 808]|nr:hypothetical protein BHU16_02005 [Tannerella sp. oral taxon 808]
MKRPLTHCALGLLTALLIAVSVGRFCVGRYAVATRAMQPSLRPGERIVVDKLHRHYAIPRSAIVLFRSPHDGRTLLLGRSVGLPGDTLSVTPSGYLIRDRLYPYPVDSPSVYRVPRDLRLSLLTLLCFLDIPVRHLTDDTAHFRLRLTPSEAGRVRQTLPLMLLPTPRPDPSAPHARFILPAARCPQRIDGVSLRLCREALLREARGHAAIRSGRLFIDGQPATTYTFREDYYWILSDNAAVAIDSRHLGPIPRSAIVGLVVGR